ncbi:MAG: hypothetical protein Q8S13_10085 [Dehalococcoidia bacterium]|nr:hypothetical protein [Dehalococcoidia bacterium]
MSGAPTFLDGLAALPSLAYTQQVMNVSSPLVLTLSLVLLALPGLPGASAD